MSISDRLKIAMQNAGVTQAQLARACGVKPPSINGWLSGKAKFLRGENLLSAASYLNVSQEWLATGVGKMQNQQTNIEKADIGTRKIPLISFVQAGTWKEIGDVECFEFLLSDLDLSKKAFALQIKGDSMLPDFRPGDRIIIDPDVAPQPGDFVVAKNGKEEATFKKYRPRGISENGTTVFELVPLNEDYPSMRNDLIQIHIVGTMVEHRRYRKKY